jgi:hypothetical protein
MSHHNSALVRRWFDEIWNRGNVDAVDKLLDMAARRQG